MQDTRATCGGGAGEDREQGAVAGDDGVRIFVLRDVGNLVVCDQPGASAEPLHARPRSREQRGYRLRVDEVCAAGGVRLPWAGEVDEDVRASAGQGRLQSLGGASGQSFRSVQQAHDWPKRLRDVDERLRVRHVRGGDDLGDAEVEAGDGAARGAWEGPGADVPSVCGACREDPAGEVAWGASRNAGWVSRPVSVWELRRAFRTGDGVRSADGHWVVD
mmetsp:Transcript_3215/g.10862  ORF Transcript_3215/g.10862 Transcript_3215/m.10862 type:complete len:218 (+) Transcript_3215:891-1544(+)